MTGMRATEPTTGMPTETELITLLRARVRRLEGAIGAYFDSAQEIGTAMSVAWRGVETWQQLRDAGVRLSASATVDAFLTAYRESLPRREDALTALWEAVREDFRQAVLTAPDMTDAQRAHWVALCDADEKDRAQ